MSLLALGVEVARERDLPNFFVFSKLYRIVRIVSCCIRRLLVRHLDSNLCWMLGSKCIRCNRWNSKCRHLRRVSKSRNCCRGSKRSRASKSSSCSWCQSIGTNTFYSRKRSNFTTHLSGKRSKRKSIRPRWLVRAELNCYTKIAVKYVYIVFVQLTGYCVRKFVRNNMSFACEYIYKSYQANFTLRRHVTQCHGGAIASIGRRGRKLIGATSCDVCGASYARKKGLQRHRKVKYCSLWSKPARRVDTLGMQKTVITFSNLAGVHTLCTQVPDY